MAEAKVAKMAYSSPDQPERRLREAFSTSAAAPETPNYAESFSDSALPTSEVEAWRIIGIGTCGTIFDIPSTGRALKKGTEGVWRDYCLTNRVHNAGREVLAALQDAFPNAVIPRTPLCHKYSSINAGTQEDWDQLLQHLPKNHRNKQA